MKEKVKECTSEISYRDYYDACDDVYYPARKFYENLNIEYNITNIDVYEGKVNIAGGFWKGFKNLFRRKKNINKEEFEKNMRSIKNEILNDLDKTKKNINDKMSKLDKEISFDNEQVQNILKIEKNKISTESWEKLVLRYRKVEKELIKYKILDE